MARSALGDVFRVDREVSHPFDPKNQLQSIFVPPLATPANLAAARGTTVRVRCQCLHSVKARSTVGEYRPSNLPGIHLHIPTVRSGGTDVRNERASDTSTKGDKGSPSNRLLDNLGTEHVLVGQTS
jgi:hypothetical protein